MRIGSDVLFYDTNCVLELFLVDAGRGCFAHHQHDQRIGIALILGSKHH